MENHYYITQKNDRDICLEKQKIWAEGWGE